MRSFNLSDWALRHRSFIWFIVIIAVVAGIGSYVKLGRAEDPPFTTKTMLVQVQWPGATVDEVMNEIADRIEKEVQQVPMVDYVNSYTLPGSTTIYVHLKDSTGPKLVPDLFYQVRKHVYDIQSQFPAGALPPSFNDEFGDVYGTIYAFAADGFSMRQLHDFVETARRKVLTVPNIGKMNVIGAQDEVVYLNFSTRKLAAQRIAISEVVTALQQQNAVVPAGTIQAGPEQVTLRVAGAFSSDAALRDVNLRLNNRFFRLSDIADIVRGTEDPPRVLFRSNGKPAIGLGIAMAKNGNLLDFGEALKARMQDIVQDMPIGVDVKIVSDQTTVVEDAVGGFVKALVEAIVIVLGVSFVSLGVRAGLVVSFSIPLVLAAVFVVMEMAEISLQRISLGALIIALGLLVDDAMITVESMVGRLEAGDKLEQAATFAYTSTAIPMLVGTLVTVAGFLPVAFNSSAAGEYTFSLFVVIASSLLISWVVAVLLAPLIGVVILPKAMKHKQEKRGRFMGLFVKMLEGSMRHRWITIGVTLLLLGAAGGGLGFVQQQFFPESDRPELLVDVTLPDNSTIAETRKQMDRLEASLVGDDDVESWSSYVGQGAIRFYLPLDVQLPNSFFGQVVVLAKSLEARARVKARLDAISRKDFTGIDVWAHSLEMGPPVGRPIQYRLTGDDIDDLRGRALALAGVVASNPHLSVPTLDWNLPGKVVRLEVMQNKARELGLSSSDIGQTLNGITAGTTITAIRDSIYLVDVRARSDADERTQIGTLENLQIPLADGRVVPLATVARLVYTTDQPIVWRRDREPTITVKANIIDKQQPPTVVKELAPAIEKFAAELPSTYQLNTGGTVEEAAKGQGPVVAIVPVMLLVMALILMVQLQSFVKLFLVFSVAPLGLIGVVAALLASGKPLGFVAILGVLALVGIIVRNSVILIAEVDEREADGKHPWTAVLEATEHRMRPILLTAAAASLGMVPIAFEVFWGPMAFAMIGGIVAATFLTLLFLPALYVACYRVQEPSPTETEGNKTTHEQHEADKPDEKASKTREPIPIRQT